MYYLQNWFFQNLQYIFVLFLKHLFRRENEYWPIFRCDLDWYWIASRLRDGFADRDGWLKLAGIEYKLPSIYIIHKSCRAYGLKWILWRLWISPSTKSVIQNGGAFTNVYYRARWVAFEWQIHRTLNLFQPGQITNSLIASIPFSYRW